MQEKISKSALFPGISREYSHLSSTEWTSTRWSTPVSLLDLYHKLQKPYVFQLCIPAMFTAFAIQFTPTLVQTKRRQWTHPLFAPTHPQVPTFRGRQWRPVGHLWTSTPARGAQAVGLRGWRCVLQRTADVLGSPNKQFGTDPIHNPNIWVWINTY